ncbi:Patatin-like phospholipase [Dyella sp. OK004]|uniref:patatin-like phospholipase family protein n=1 Tax=Dyella sp. OK004 TaxID=1855292 RepID=UPI0008EECD5F|nr:patatin-like phospholipase family protein [Dyella sp. OK004]SFS04865.1 Patatin-like phospholipase [Dyella sp. OK004]
MMASDNGAKDSRVPHEIDVYNKRRERAGIDRHEPAIGLALSGGGIRSATFCLGILRAMAKNKVLHRIDYLSTVSGGGYIGASLGRLFKDKARTPREVEQGLASDHSLLLWWLRNNGRYLTPAGANDVIMAVAGQVRSFLVTQFEVLMLALVLACIVTFPHLLASLWLSPGQTLFFAGSPWWWLLLLPAALALTAAYAYWFLGRNRLPDLLTALLAAIVGIYAMHVAMAAFAATDDAVSNDSVITVLAYFATVLAIGFLLSPLGWIWARFMMGRPENDDKRRLMLTHVLSHCLRASLALALLGAMDLFSWYLGYLFMSVLSGQLSFQLGVSFSVVTLVVVVARNALPIVQANMAAAKRLPLTQIANILGLLLIMFIALLWLALVQVFVLSKNDNFAGTPLPGALGRWLCVFGAAAVFLLINGSVLQQLNRSSLHFFYRSRLARAYVSVGNDELHSGDAHGGDKPRFPASVLAKRRRDITDATAQVADLLNGDDVAMKDYQPATSGGPIHLINCCINQTEDDRTGNYNADRKGVNLTVSALGVETGTHGPVQPGHAAWEKTTLAEWIAISGAAVGSGMGSLTKPGMAAMIFLSGLRLGYWQHNLTKQASAGFHLLQKYQAMCGEMFARFPGLRAPRWYLSDGGHFDNTGVYALLKRKLPVIILADCGADPDYAFGDVENLIRKARIDHDAIIRFIDPESLPPLAGGLSAFFGTPDSIQPGTSNEYLLLAQITYSDDCTGALLIIKPRRTEDMPLDVAGYAARNASFPQQSTANQFFSEEEWESYCNLGLTLGRVLTTKFLHDLHPWINTGTTIGTNNATLTPPITRMTRNQRIATTLGTSIGIGAILTGLLAGWQAWNTRQDKDSQQLSAFATEARTILADISSPERQHKGFDQALDAKIDLLNSIAHTFPVNSDQQQVMQDIAEPLQNLCPPYGQALFNRCAADVVTLNAGARSSMHWDEAMASYSGFATNAPLLAGEGQQALATTSAATPKENSAGTPSTSMPSPPPPPPSSVLPSEPVVVTAQRQSEANAVAAAPEHYMPNPASVVTQAAPTRQSLPPSATPQNKSAFDRAKAACVTKSSQSFVLYTQIYDEAQRAPLSAVLTDIRSLGIATPGVENVTVTAKRNGNNSPARWNQPTILYRAEGQDCAQALAIYLTPFGSARQAVRAFPLPRALNGAANILELWIPNPSDATGTK